VADQPVNVPIAVGALQMLRDHGSLSGIHRVRQAAIPQQGSMALERTLANITS